MASVHTCICFLTFLGFMLAYRNLFSGENVNTKTERVMYNRKNESFHYHKNLPLVFIGGMPRSGTTLMRAMLDAHPEVRCGEETHIIPQMLQMHSQMKQGPLLSEAGITETVLNSAVSSFILDIIALHGEAAPYLCNKDPFTLSHMIVLRKMYPNAKFIYMVRDGRGTVHSMITRGVTVGGFDLKSYGQCMSKWSIQSEIMYTQCLQVGEEKCMLVYYEQLVLQPEQWMKRILEFLDIPWDPTVLRHQDFIERPGGISVSKSEASTNQIIKPVNVEALSKWAGNIPEDVVRDMAKLAPMLSAFGYDPEANPPKYGEPDTVVAANTQDIKQNEELWREKEKEVQKPYVKPKRRPNFFERLEAAHGRTY